MVEMGEVLRSMGSLAGMVALVWRGFDETRSYLRISLALDEPKDRWVTALTSVENSGLRGKQLIWAFLLVGPQDEATIETANKVLDSEGVQRIKRMYEMYFLKTRIVRPLSSECRMLIPLPFYYAENTIIRDERLSYRYPISTIGFPRDIPISVRFYLAGHFYRHRFTHDCFVIPLTTPNDPKPTAPGLTANTDADTSCPGD